MATRRASANESEVAVHRRHPHYVLLRETFEAKCRLATWRCIRHDVEFRSPASALASPGNLGCPACKEDRAREKRRERYADPKLDQHLAVIQDRLGVAAARIWALRSQGLAMTEISAEVGVSANSVGTRLWRMRRLLRDTRT